MGRQPRPADAPPPVLDKALIDAAASAAAKDAASDEIVRQLNAQGIYIDGFQWEDFAIDIIWHTMRIGDDEVVLR